MIKKNYYIVFLLGFTLLACMGCGGNKFPVAKVEGTVTCDSKPVAFVQVNFSPKRVDKSVIVGKGAIAYTDENGKFILSTYGINDGAVVGKHEVTVSATSETDRNCPATLSRYGVVQEIDVEKKKNDFTIDLPVRAKGVALEIPNTDS